MAYKKPLVVFFVLLFTGMGIVFAQSPGKNKLRSKKQTSANNIRQPLGTGPVLVPPAITYVSPQTYYVNNAIVPLSPTNNGGPVPSNIYGEVSTFAGSGAAGSSNGTGLAASFNGPAGLTFDAAGNLYVSEAGNNDIRLITPAAVVSTYYIDPNPGSAQITAQLSSPQQIVLDASGALYIADQGDMQIKKLVNGALPVVYAGTGAQSSLDGTVISATFNQPTGLAFDASGSLYVADRGTSKLRKIDPTGQVTTAAVLHGGAAPTFNTGLYYLTTDAAGNVYFVDSNQVMELTTSGSVIPVAGNGIAGVADGPAGSAEFNKLTGITLDGAGDIFVSDAANNLIRRVSGGSVATLAGSGGHGNNNGVSASASFNAPDGLAIDNNGQFLYVADAGNNQIRKIAITGYGIDKSLPVGLSFDGFTGTISGTPVSPSPATVYTITAYNAGGSSSFQLTIAVDAVTVTFNAIPIKTVCDADFDPGATGNGPITYTSSNPAVATIVAGKVHIIGPGTSTISASDGTTSATQLLTVSQPLVPSIIVSPSVYGGCIGMSLTFTTTIQNGGTNPVYQWQVNGQNTGTNSPTFTSAINSNDKVTCILTSNAPCTSTPTVTSNVATAELDPYKTATISITSSATGPVCPGTEVVFTANPVAPGYQLDYYWQLNGQTIGTDNPTFTTSSLNNGDVVSCILGSSGECIADPLVTSNAITISVSPIDLCTVQIPTAFTPNGDGINDLWNITALQGYPNCTISIFNRYGNVVYNTIGYPKAWDGTYNGHALPTGTYYYIIDLKNGKKKLSGSVTIIR